MFKLELRRCLRSGIPVDRYLHFWRQRREAQQYHRKRQSQILQPIWQQTSFNRRAGEPVYEQIGSPADKGYFLKFNFEKRLPSSWRVAISRRAFKHVKNPRKISQSPAFVAWIRGQNWGQIRQQVRPELNACSESELDVGLI